MKKTKAKILFLIAVLLELIGNFIISYTDGFTVLVPSVICFLIYSASAVFFGFSLKEINLGIAYAVWSGVGIISWRSCPWHGSICLLPKLISSV